MWENDVNFILTAKIRINSSLNHLWVNIYFEKNKIWKPKKGKVLVSTLPSRSELELRRISTMSFSDDDDDIYDEVFDVRSVSSH